MPLRLYNPPRHHIANLPTTLTPPRRLIRLECIHGLLDLRPQIRTVKTRLVHNLPAPLTIPPQRIHTIRRTGLLEHNPNGISEANGIMRRIRREEKHAAFVNRNVAVGRFQGGRFGGLDDFKEHGAFVLVEPFGGGIDVVVCAGVGAADDHDGYVVVVDAVVIYGGFEEVGVFFEPVGREKGLVGG